MKLRSAEFVSTASATKERGVDTLPILKPDYWEEVFVEEDPWKFGSSDYEKWKFDLTLSALPAGRIRNAVELGCAEGHFTQLLAPHVDKLLGLDISPTAIRRARARCAKLKNVEFKTLNMVEDALPGNLDLLQAGEVLFYLPLRVLEEVAPKIAASLKPGGHLLLCHGNVITDDKTQTGFDWGHEVGGLKIGKVFAALDELTLARSLRTPLFTIDLFQRKGGRKRQKETTPVIEEIPLPMDLELLPELESTLIWGGAVMTRAEAQESEAVSEIPILMYHSIADSGPAELAPYRISPAAFREQMQYLRRNGFHSITLAEWGECIAQKKKVPGRPIIITFDDGYQDFLQNAWPALERTDLSATVFIVTDKAGGAADWDKLPQPLQLLGWDDLRSLAAKGITLGSHTASHVNLDSASPDQVRLEGERSRKRLKDELGEEVDIIAYPWGESNETARSVIGACGYTVGVRSWGGPSTLNDDPLHLSRIEILPGDDIAAFARKLTAKVDEGSDEADAKDRPPADSEVVGFKGGDTAADQGSSMPTHPDYARSLSARLDALVGEFVKLQNQLLKSTTAPPTLQSTLAGLFTLPITGKITRTVEPAQEIIPGVQVSFEEGSIVNIWVEPKADHSLSPQSHLNTLGISFSGDSKWLSLEIALDWADLSLAQRFQISLYGQPSRPILCEGGLRLPRKGGEPTETIFASFPLSSDERNVAISGEIAIPDFIELDTREKPHLLLFFDTESDLSLVIHYFNVYFA